MKLVIPMHYKTFGLLTGTPEAVEQLLERDDVKIVPIVPGNVFEAHYAHEYSIISLDYCFVCFE